jgi:hypothetical protein
MRKKVWNELAQIRHSLEYLALFLDVQKSRKKWFNILTVIFSTGGVMGWKMWEYAPAVACAIIAVIHLFKLLENQVMLSDEKFEKLSELRTKHLEYSNDLEKLWFEFENGCKDEVELRNTYFELRKEHYTKIQKMDDALNIPNKDGELIKRSDILATNYLEKHF